MTKPTTTLIEISVEAFEDLEDYTPRAGVTGYSRAILNLARVARAARRLRLSAAQGIALNPHAWEDLYQALDSLEGSN